MGEKPFQIMPEREATQEDSPVSIGDGPSVDPEPPGFRPPEKRPVLPNAEEGTTPLIGGLSDEEVRDLDTLIRNLKNKSPESASDESLSEASRATGKLEKRLAEMGEMILKFDGSLKTAFELLRLFQRKSEILNHRIHRLEKHLHGEEKGRTKGNKH